MRAGGASKNPLDGIIRTLTHYPWGRGGSGTRRLRKRKRGNYSAEHSQSQGVEGRAETEWNRKESSSSQLKSSGNSGNLHIGESNAMRMELLSDKGNLGASGNSICKANQCAVSRKPNGLTVGGEGGTAHMDLKLSPTGCEGDCSGKDERESAFGWSVMNTKPERTELTQSDEEQMLRLSQISTAEEGKLPEQPLNLVTSDTNETPKKRRKQQTRETRKRPSRAPTKNLLARDIFEVLQSESDPLERNHVTDRQMEKQNETDCMETTECFSSEGEDRQRLGLNSDTKKNRNRGTALEQDNLMGQSEPLDDNDAIEDIPSSAPLKRVVIRVHCSCPSECKNIPSNAKQDRIFSGGIPECESNHPALSSEKLRPLDKRCGKPGHDARGAREDSQREANLHRKSGMNIFNDNNCDETNKNGKGMTVISTMHDLTSPKELEGTSGESKHPNGILQSEAKSCNCLASNSDSGDSGTGGLPLPSGEDGYNLSKEGVQMGLQVRLALLGHSKRTQDDYHSPRAESQSPVCQDVNGVAKAREQNRFQPNYEDLCKNMQRSSRKAITCVQPFVRDANMNPNVKSTSEVELLSPSLLTAKRRVRRKHRKAESTEPKEQLPRKHEIIAQEESQRSEKSDEPESDTHIRFTHTHSGPASPSNEAKIGHKARRKKPRSKPLLHRGSEGGGVTAQTDHARGLEGGEQDHAQQQKARGTEAGSSKIGNLDGTHSKNHGSGRSSNYSRHPKANNMNEKKNADGAEDIWAAPVMPRTEQFSLTDEGNRGSSVSPAAGEKATALQRQDQVSHMEPSIKPNLDESIVDVDIYAAEREQVKAVQGMKLKGEDLNDLVDPTELSKQSQLLRKRPKGPRKSRTDGARHEPRPKALDELSDNEDSKNNECRPAVSSSRSRQRSVTAQIATVKTERTHPMTTRRRASQFASTLHRGAAVIDLTDAGENEDAATNSRTAEGDDGIAESLRELQRLSLEDREKSFSARPRCKYLTPLNSDENKLATQLVTRTKLETRIVTIAEAGITLRGESFKRLRGTRWLDDEVLNAYVSLINSRNDAVFYELSEGDRSGIPRTYMFNTYFFTRLCCHSSGFDYPGVQGWTKRAKVDILQKDIILVPINLGNHHWVLSGIDMEHQEIMYLDSMRGPDTAKAISKLKRWVFEELRNKHGDSVAQRYDPHSWKEVKHSYRVRRIGVLPASLESREAKAGRVARVPTQSDGGSCGVFTAKMADCLSLGIKVYFKQGDIPLIRRRMALDLFNGYLPL